MSVVIFAAIGLLSLIVFGALGAKYDNKYDEEVEEWETNQREIERIEQERNRQFVQKTRERIVENQGYELNILPFLAYLIEASNNDYEFFRIVRGIEEKSKYLIEYAEEANRISRDNDLGITLHIHVK